MINKLFKLLLSIFVGTDIAPTGYILGIGFSVLGIILCSNLIQTNYIIGAIFLTFVGLVILFFRIRKDVKEMKNDLKK